MVVVVRRAQLLLLLVAALSAAAVAHAHAHAQHGEGVRGRGGTLRGSVACLDCSPGHDLSGVVVALQ
uniref:Uncharacterized protein n=1 Tax=Oryza punctata TaxID=4537 RepID=A0A0E0K0P3_ORYPU